MTLLSRLENAEQGSRELDAEMLIALLPNDYRAWYAEHGYMECRNADNRFEIQTAGDSSFEQYPNPTTDLSAAVALMERVLPGHSFSISRSSDGSNFAEIGRGPDGALIEDAMCDGDVTPVTLPLALCIALLKALEAKEPSA